MNAHDLNEVSTLDVRALLHFLARSQGYLLQMQSILTTHAPIIDARALQSMIQWSREIAFGAEVANLAELADAADEIERLALEALRTTTPSPIELAARLGEHLRALETELQNALKSGTAG